MSKRKKTTSPEEIQQKVAQAAEEDKTPLEKFIDFKEAVKKLVSTDLARFHLRIRDIGDAEFILYQGTMSNVWARFNVKQKTFYRTALERQFEKRGLIEPSNEIVIRR